MTKSTLLLTAVIVVVISVTAAGLVAAAHALGGSGQAPTSMRRLSGIPAAISTQLAQDLELSPLPGPAAPAVRLTDQHGQRVSLAQFRGKVVVLEFMDDRCTDICPVVAAEFEAAYRKLGPLASRVVFAAINANPFAVTVSDVATFTREHGLAQIPDWHYLTGPLPQLKTAWSAYHITVTASSPAKVVHTSATYFIDPSGKERFLADADIEENVMRYHRNGTGYVPAATSAAWATGIAALARYLLTR